MAVPNSDAAASITVSDRVGCGWMQRSRSSAVAPISTASTPSARPHQAILAAVDAHPGQALVSDDRTLGRSNTYRVTFEVLRMLQVAFGTPVSPDYGHQSSALVDIHGWDGPFFIWNLAP